MHPHGTARRNRTLCFRCGTQQRSAKRRRRRRLRLRRTNDCGASCAVARYSNAAPSWILLVHRLRAEPRLGGVQRVALLHVSRAVQVPHSHRVPAGWATVAPPCMFVPVHDRRVLQQFPPYGDSSARWGCACPRQRSRRPPRSSAAPCCRRCCSARPMRRWRASAALSLPMPALDQR